MSHVLDNPIWHALTGPHAPLAIGRQAARRYPQDIGPFAAIADATATAYSDLAADLPAGGDAVLFRPSQEDSPTGWETLLAKPLTQMILPSAASLPEPRPAGSSFIPLSLQDAADMRALVELTQPGPFASRTVELGGYFGVRDSAGRLIAMAGQRFHLPGYAEVSAVCVHPDAQGQGLGGALTAHVARAIFTRGDVPILHAWPDNPAISLYRRLGFDVRTSLWVLWRRQIATETAV